MMQKFHSARFSAAVACLAGVLGAGPGGARAAADGPLADMSLEELANLHITSVSGRPQAARTAAASVYVITAEDIRRSTADSVPEVLRLAPNLQVARINASQYAISARGFNNSIGNKLLVLVDGRTVYSPLFSGVFWDAQAVVLQDVERIEIISGPGATLWGANAVNGVINIITRSASDSPGALLAAGAGPQGSLATLRYGGSAGAGLAWRAYATRTDRNATQDAGGADRPDASRREQLGFRVDRETPGLHLTLQGDAYRSGDAAPNNAAPRLGGGNLLGRVSSTAADGSNWQLQAYLDRTRRDDGVAFRDHERTVDVEFNHVPAPLGRHKLIWGVAYRQARSEATPTALVLFDPTVRALRWSSVFVQDEIDAGGGLRVTAGANVQSNVYTGAEVLPTLRALFEMDDATVFWAGLSRAVRAPARVDRDFYFPGKAPFLIAGGPNFRSEVATVAEIGLRGQPGLLSRYSVTVFHSRYDRLRAGRAAPTTIDNLASGQVAGIEAWGSVDVSRGWRLSGGLVELSKRLQARPEAGAGSVSNLGNDPRHQWLLRSTAELSAGVELDAQLRHVCALPDPAVPAYTAMDLRLAWRLAPGWHAGLALQNLGDTRHLEYAGASQLRRTASLQLAWQPR